VAQGFHSDAEFLDAALQSPHLSLVRAWQFKFRFQETTKILLSRFGFLDELGELAVPKRIALKREELGLLR
jgi:hypothetical protein